MQRARGSTVRPVLPGGSRVLSVKADKAGKGAVSVTRHRAAAAATTPIVAKMHGEAAFVMLFQLSDYPAHEFKLDGRFERVAALSRNTLNIVDLRIGDACGRLLHPSDTLMFHMPVEAVAAIMGESSGHFSAPIRAPEPWQTRDPIIEALAPVLLQALDDPFADDNHLFHDHLLLGFGAHVARHYAGWRPRQERRRGLLAPWQERRAKELLAASLDGPVLIADVARECSLSPDYFTRAFRATTGETPHLWLQSKRVAQAKNLLATTGLSLAEIAQLCGFSDQSHLSRQFSRHVGTSPQRWRRNGNVKG